MLKWLNRIPFVDKILGNDDVERTITQTLSRGGGVDINIQDQTTRPIVAYMSLLEKETALTNAVAIGDTVMTVDDPTGFTAGKYISIFDVASNRFYLASQIGAAAGSVITLDTPMDFAFPIGAFVTAGDRNLGNHGGTLAEPVVFGLRNTEVAIGKSFDITRIIIAAVTANPVDLSKFADILALTNGLVLRRKDGEYHNIFNAKTNSDLAALMYDFTIHAATNPSQGQDGLVGRLTFAGQSKMGVAIRLAPGEDLQVLIQDALGAIDILFVIAEGHEVDEPAA